MRSKDMSSQREWSLNNLLRQLRELRETLPELRMPYTTALERVAQMPVEFERRWWSSRVDMLVQKLKVDYQKHQAQAGKVDLLTQFMTVAVDSVLKAGGMEPVPLPDSLRVGISISVLGKIEPALLDDSSPREGGVLVKFEEFEAIAQRLKEEILKGKIMPESEEEIPKLIHDYALRQK